MCAGVFIQERESMKRAVLRITSPVTAVRHCWSNFTGCLVSQRATCDLPKPTGSFSYDWGIELSAIKCLLFTSSSGQCHDSRETQKQRVPFAELFWIWASAQTRQGTEQMASE